MGCRRWGRGWWGWGTEPYLDGLRAVAVYLVVLFHAGSRTGSRAGSSGVDVFFVLSGFLVTRLLLRDLVGRGRIRFGAVLLPAGSGGCCPPRSSR